MGKRFAKRFVAGLMCISLVFQSSQVVSFAAEQNTSLAEIQQNDENTSLQEESMDRLESSSTAEDSEQESLETQDTTIAEESEVHHSKMEEITETEQSEIEESSELESLTVEESSEQESLETEESFGTEQSESEETNATEMIENGETESVTETEEQSSTEETITPGEFQNVSVEFDGYLAIINAEFIPASNANMANCYIVSYDTGETEITSTNVYLQKDDNNIYNISEHTVNLYNEVHSIKLKAIQYDASNNELEDPVYSDVFVREQIPEIHFSAGEPEIGVGSITVPYYFDGNMHRSEGKESSDFYFDVQLNYGIDSVEENSSGMYRGWFKGEDKESFSIRVNGLEENTTYHAQLLIEISGTDSERGNIYEQTISLPNFTTPTDTTYDLEQEFPDEVFRGQIRIQLSLDETETTIKESQLGEITYLNLSRTSIAEPAIKDIKGIELLCNVNSVELSGHEIADISNIEWEKLIELQSLSLQGNCIESLPDFTKNTNLQYLYISDNFIPSAEILNLQDKLPEGCNCWDYAQRQKEFKLITEEKYYQTNGKSEVALRIQGYNGCFSSVFKVYIDNNLIETQSNSFTDNNGYNYRILYNQDVPYEIGPHTLKLEMYESGSEKPTETKEVSFEIVGQKTFLMDRSDTSKITDVYYISAQEESLSVNIYGEKEVTDIYLVKDEMIYGKNDWLNSNSTESYFNKYPQLGSYYSASAFYYSTSASIYINKQQLATGTYDLKLVFQDHTEEILEGTIEVINSAIIKSVSAGSSYDHTGDYLYLALSADYLDPSLINYTIKKNDNSRTLQTEYVDCKPIYNGYVVKLKKIGWNNDVTEIRVYFSGKEDYPLYVVNSYNYCYIENMLYFSNYNYQSNMLEIGITSQSNIADYTYSIVRTDLPWDFSTEHICEEYTVKLEEVEDTIYNVIPKWEGEECTLYGGYYRFSILSSGIEDPIRIYDFYIPGLVVERSKRLNDNGYWGNSQYNLIQQGIGRATRSYYSEIPYVEGNEEDFSAQITGELLYSPLDAQRIYTWNYSSDVYKTGIDMEFDYSMLELGDYTIELYYRNSLLAEYEIQVIPNNIFVLYDAYASWNQDDTFHINFYTPNCGESDEYTIQMTDINGNNIEGLNITYSYKSVSYSYVDFYIEGLKKSEADRYYYIKLLHNTKGDAVCEDLETKYYKNTYGKYTAIYRNSDYGWNYLNVDGVTKGITGIWHRDTTMFPATLNIYKFNGTERYYSRGLTEEDFDGGNFYFTQEIIDALPRANGYYDLVLIGKEGQFLNETRVQIALNTDILNAFRVVPSSMTLKLNVEEESSKTITAINSTETPTFESDDTTIADVTVSEEDPNAATVEAVGVGRTSITVISGGNIKKVIVEVTESPIDAENIQFYEDHYRIVQGTNIFANVKIEPENAWISTSKISYESSDETIVSVGDSTTRNITLTANNPGIATITAKLEGTELTAQCTVTVLAGYTEEERAELIASIGSLYFLEGAEQTLADIRLPEGWRWSNPSQKPTADSDRPTKEFTAIYAKDGLDFFTTPLSVHITNVSTKIAGATELHLSTIETYKFMFEFGGYKPADNTTYAASFRWVGNDNLKIQGKDDQGEVTIQAGATPGTYTLQGTIFLKNTKTGKELVQTLKHNITIKDNTDEINAEIMKKTYYFLAGADTSLKDIPIGDGWSWAQPNLVPQADASLPVQTFAAKYNVEGRQPINARLSVAVTTLDTVNISGATKIAAERISSYRLRYQYTGYNINDANGYDVSYQWKVSDGITIEGADNVDAVTVKTGSTPGNYTLVTEVIVKNIQTGKTTKIDGNYTIQILDRDSIDSIVILPADQQPEKALACAISNGALESDYASFNNKTNFKIQLAANTTASGITKSTPVVWASSDEKVAAIDTTGLVIVKKAGITVISATSTDKGGYSEEILLKIQDFTPTMEKKTLTVFQYSSTGAELGLSAQSSNQIQSVTVSGASGLTATQASGIWYLKANGYSNKKVENIVLQIETDKGTYEKPLKVTVDVTQPKATLKQSVKPNIFYTNADAVFKVTSKYAIAQIEDASSASEVCFHVKDYDAQAGMLTLAPKDITKNIERYKTKNSDALKAKVKITFVGYTEPIKTTIKITVQNKKPSLRIDSASFMKDTGIDEVLTIVRNGKTAYNLNNATVKSKTEKVGTSVFNGKLRLNYNGSSKISYKVDIQDKDWTQAVTVVGKIQMINADALALQAETQKITINKANLSAVEIPVAVRGNSGLEPNIDLKYDSNAMTVSYQDGVVIIKVLESAQDKTYKIEVGGTIEAAGRTFDIKKAVMKVTVTSKEASVKLMASGKIDIADRKYSATTYTPTLRNMDANIVAAEVIGELSEYFYADLDKAEKIVLKAVSGKPLKANQKYTIDIATYFDNGYQTVTKVNIKPVNKLPKVKASLSNGTLYKANTDSKIKIQLILDARYDVSQVRLAENQYHKYFILTQEETGIVTVALSEYGMKLSSGTYSIPYQVLIADADNTKPITKKIQIIVR